MENKKYDILCIGLMVSDLLVMPARKEIFDVDTTQVDKIELAPGGDAMNESIILARLGVKVGLIGKVGSDLSGRMLLMEAEKNGVDISNVKIDKDTKTTISIVLINNNGDRNFIYSKGNNDTFCLNDIDLSVIGQARIVSVGSIFELPMLDKNGIEIIFKEAKVNNVITAADVTHDVYGLGLNGIKSILQYTDIFIPSYIEAVYLTNEKEPDKAAEILLEHGVKIVVIKMGAKGCYIQTLTEHYFINAYDVVAVDTTGAGDNFVAGFLTGILNGWNLKQCGMFANAVGSICVDEAGATTAVKSMNQVMQFMKDTKERLK
jgi:sugar/nucleoside kinase (ribokinase family)